MFVSDLNYFFTFTSIWKILLKPVTQKRSSTYEGLGAQKNKPRLIVDEVIKG